MVIPMDFGVFPLAGQAPLCYSENVHKDFGFTGRFFGPAAYPQRKDSSVFPFPKLKY
jgi:hypothetical protein